MSQAPLNRSEAFVLEVCQKSFLAPWCYNNPRAKPGKELCDILVVCDPDIIIVSVKEITFSENTDFQVAHDRWERKAVDASVNQIYGAEGWLKNATQVIRPDGTLGLMLPPPETRRLHRIAVALGDKGQAITSSGDFGEGFVHVMGEDSFREVLSELNTITDLTDYFIAKERLAESKTRIVCGGPESNMLGWYLTHQRSFPKDQDVVIFDESIWPGLQSNASFIRRKEADRISYAWDELIVGLFDPEAKPLNGPEPKLDQVEQVLRVMARESRLNRRVLSEQIVDFMGAAKAGRSRARIMRGPSGVIYVFTHFDAKDLPEHRSAELTARCYVARYIAGEGNTMVGVGLGAHQLEKGTTSDLVYMHFPEWSAEEDAIAKKLKEDSGFFANMPVRHVHRDEYPAEE